jgi:hypothetical protein
VISDHLFNTWYSNSFRFHLASSCDVERGFSRGGLTVTKLRHQLSDHSTRAATVVNSWHTFPGLIPEAEIIQTFKDKPRRQRPGSSSLASQAQGELDSIALDSEDDGDD